MPDESTIEPKIETGWTSRANAFGDIYVMDGDSTTLAIVPSTTRGKEDIAHQISCLPNMMELMRSVANDLCDLNNTGAHFEAERLRAALREMRALI